MVDFVVDIGTGAKNFVKKVFFGVGVIINLVVYSDGHIIRDECAEVSGYGLYLYTAHDGVGDGMWFFFRVACENYI